MLKLDLANVIENINARRSRVRYSFQELALLLAEKLNDQKSKALYMRIAKHEEQELIMKAYSYTMNSPNLSDNKGRFFMWKLKQLKEALIEPLKLQLDLAPIEDTTILTKKLISIFEIDIAKRANYPYICALVAQLREKYGESLAFELKLLSASSEGYKYAISSDLFFRIKNTAIGFFKEIDENYELKPIYQVVFTKQEVDLFVKKEQDKFIIKGALLLTAPKYKAEK